MNLIEKFSLLHFHAEEVARQLTIVDQELFIKILPKELLNQAWTKSHRHETSPNVMNMIDRFNKVSTLAEKWQNPCAALLVHVTNVLCDNISPRERERECVCVCVCEL